ncbi:putative branched-subunit amino acid permease [Azospirillum fermentarium]|uniref:AzlC family ABC transporter permease n=1 Tax=Azospirillum fermentarium TaxID=1233114 RepID=UPI00222663DB|nr:AzlC family ABC transporter permease [Azospirillum fermentarium]MCW2247511.1 putative branched-subunit amino acid permease [Azospirillum fermentarium]
MSEPSGIARTAVREALGMPGLVLFASYLGFGSLARETGFGLGAGLVSTATGWALPGQMALVELWSIGASLLAVGLAVALTNTRLLPMVVTLLPLLRTGAAGRRAPRWCLYALAHVIAVTTWANAMRRLPDLPPESRLAWFTAYGATLFMVTMAGTAGGFFLAGVVPEPVTLGLVFLNPIYFLMLFAVDLKQRARVLALAFGLVMGPLLHPVAPTYGLLVTGLTAGTLAFVLDFYWSRRGR